MRTKRSRGVRPPGNDSQGGFTLVEVLVSVVILSLITGGLAAAFITSMRSSTSSRESVRESNDAQLIAAFLVRDAQAAGGTDPLTGTADDPTLGLSAANNGCTTTGSLILSFKWIDRSQGANHTRVANYSYVSSSQQVIRTTCDDTVPPAGAPLANNAASVLGHDIVNMPTIACTDASGGSVACSGMPASVSMTLTESNNPTNATAPYTYTLTASLRPQSEPAPSLLNSSNAPLLVLGSGSCGTTAINESGGASVRVYGSTFINAACNAMNLSGSALYQAGSTSILSGGTCTASGGSICPTTSSYSPALADPYAGLTPPSTVGLSNRTASTQCQGIGSTAQPGVYAAQLVVNGSSTCTLQSGIYILRAGLSVSGGGRLTSAPGGVLLYVPSGTFSISGGGAANISAQTTGPYSGLVIWQDKADTNTVALSGGGLLTLSGTVYAPKAQVTISGGSSNPMVTAVVAQSIDLSGSGLIVVGTKSATPLSINPHSPFPTGTVGIAYPSVPAFTGAGGDGHYIWSATGLPDGLSIDPDTGVISGTPLPTGAGTAPVKVLLNDANGDDTASTATLSLTINPLPTWTSAVPASLAQGVASHTVTINGAGFVNGATLSFSGSGVTVINPVTFVNGTKLTATITVAAGATVGPRDVTVTNPDTGSVTKVGGFTVNARPTVASTSPPALARGLSNQTVTINGSGFVAGDTVAFSGAGITLVNGSTSVTGPTTITVRINIAVGATLGAGNVTVSNPADFGVGVGTNVFTVDPLPTIVSIAPPSHSRDGTTFTVTITGTNFLNGATVTFAGAGITVVNGSSTVVSSTTITVKISIAVGAAKKAGNVTVTNSDGGAVTSNNGFTVTA